MSRTSRRVRLKYVKYVFTQLVIARAVTFIVDVDKQLCGAYLKNLVGGATFNVNQNTIPGNETTIKYKTS